MRDSKRISVVAGVVASMLIAGVAFAAWTSSGNGSGYAKASSAQALSTVSAAADTTAQLYPGGSGDLVVKIHNPNPYAVTVSAVNNGSGSIATTDSTAACDASTGVTYTNASGLSLAVPANSDAEFTLVGKVHMSNASDDSCQGKTFSIPVALVGASS